MRQSSVFPILLLVSMTMPLESIAALVIVLYRRLVMVLMK